MKIAIINMVHFGSTGKIMLGIAETARRAGHQVRTFSAHYYLRRNKVVLPEIDGHTYFGYEFENALHIVLTKLTGYSNVFSWLGTWQLIRELKQYQPDVVHLHNLHNLTISVPMLLSWLKRNNIRTVWTLHDCWAFTAQCPYFDLTKCDKWKNGCHHCPGSDSIRHAMFDQSKQLWRMKKRVFSEFEQMTIVTPSLWLADLAKQSFLQNYPIAVINNGIDLSVFQPIESDFREKHGLTGKKMVLGVAFGWGVRKGLDVFERLAKELPEDYRIVLVGTNDAIDRELPANIVSIHATQNQRELAEIYSAADMFVIPTREENYPTVNMEAIACGTPVITFATGGSPEIVGEDCGIVVPCDDYEALFRAIQTVGEERLFTQGMCVSHARQFDMWLKFDGYVQLFETVMTETCK